MKASSDPKDTELATGFTVRDYKRFRDMEGRQTTADALRRRFTERYIDPALHSGHDYGFTMMAVSCLMIEAVESFRQGWDTSDGRGKAAVCFSSIAQNHLGTSRDVANSSTRMCDVASCPGRNHGRVEGCKSGTPVRPAHPDNQRRPVSPQSAGRVDDFCDGLNGAGRDSINWRNVIRKMNAIRNNWPRKAS
jgi:hypothetical protein